MVRGNTENLRLAAQTKRDAALARAEKGLRRLLKAGRPITFQTVAAEAGVSKDFLYRTSDLRERIMDLRSKTTPGSEPKRDHPRSEPPHPDTSSIVRTLAAKLAAERSTNGKKIAELEAALAAAHGEILQLRRRNPCPPPRTAPSGQ
ncbi:transposase [Arthrobacter sp. TS-15]|uniref:DUF6262 family protein n=1 Tax=unclassified Arthrobacter TaxID=235627 RepID=UPI0011674C28|nr:MULTISPECIES: DUF6262 family protein [unclassified Arthrobacter]QSZ51424.1 hypothetical protein AYX22_23205 [Arthrobacter sp. D5-1]TQS87207.1 transposase [Arthrobacter sp. TS-15]